MIFYDSNMVQTPNQQVEFNAPGKPETTFKSISIGDLPGLQF